MPYDFAKLAGQITPPDADVETAARDRQATLLPPAGALGRLGELAAWIAAAQGQSPPHDFARARVVVFAAEHGIAAAGVSAYPPETTRRLRAAIDAGTAPLNSLARLADATVRVVDLPMAAQRIDTTDALTEEETERAVQLGIQVADEEVDGGADLLVCGELGAGSTTPATVAIAALGWLEPVVATGRGSGIDDPTWMRKVVAVRDGLRRARRHSGGNDPFGLLATACGPDIAALTGFLLQAAVRRTPVVLDGLVTSAAALIAYTAVPMATGWWIASHRSTEPAHHTALDRMDLTPVLDLGMSCGEACGALTAVPLLRAAVRVASEVDGGD